MKYELINPSDKIYFECEDLDVGLFALLLVCNNAYAARPLEEGAAGIPPFLFGGMDKYTEDNFGVTPEKLAERVKRYKRQRLIDCLNSFEVDGEPSSTNDICGYAHQYAKKISEL